MHAVPERAVFAPEAPVEYPHLVAELLAPEGDPQEEILDERLAFLDDGCGCIPGWLVDEELQLDGGESLGPLRDVQDKLLALVHVVEAAPGRPADAESPEVLVAGGAARGGHVCVGFERGVRELGGVRGGLGVVVGVCGEEEEVDVVVVGGDDGGFGVCGGDEFLQVEAGVGGGCGGEVGVCYGGVGGAVAVAVPVAAVVAAPVSAVSAVSVVTAMSTMTAVSAMTTRGERKRGLFAHKLRRQPLR